MGYIAMVKSILARVFFMPAYIIIYIIAQTISNYAIRWFLTLSDLMKGALIVTFGWGLLVMLVWALATLGWAMSPNKKWGPIVIVIGIVLLYSLGIYVNGLDMFKNTLYLINSIFSIFVCVGLLLYVGVEE